MLQTTHVRRLAELPASVLAWTLDAPLNDRAVDATAGTLHVQGWLVFRQTPAQPAQLLLRPVGDATTELRKYPFNNGRPDVIRRVLDQAPSGHPQLRCGFSLQIPLPPGPLELGFELGDGTQYWAASIGLRTGVQVIEGRDGWLFLDNDSNRSVDQFIGALLLDPAALRQWRGYLADGRALASRLGARHALVIAPSKEEVLREWYPHARAATTVLDQVRAIAQPQDHLVDAAAVLAAQAQPELSFKRTDTHWTDRGAMLASLAALEAMGLSAETARACFEADQYRVEPYAGDLGVKLLPVRTAPTEFLDAPPPEGGAVFDNQLPNIGRVLVFEAPGAPFDARLLMFGASSGYPMLKYLKRLFRRVVFIHSAGHVDSEVALRERPDAMLLQSNGRFLIQAPRMDFSLRDAAATKLNEASSGVRQRAAELVAAGPRSADDAPFLEMLR